MMNLGRKIKNKQQTEDKMKKDNFDFENIIIIRNPALKLLNKSKEWDSEVESLSFYKK